MMKNIFKGKDRDSVWSLAFSPKVDKSQGKKFSKKIFAILLLINEFNRRLFLKGLRYKCVQRTLVCFE